jgi:hypothetical protein
MSSPTGSQENFDWGKATPPSRDFEELAKQIREMTESGWRLSELRIWLLNAGYSPRDAQDILQGVAIVNREGWSPRLGGGIAGVVVALMFAIVATLVVRPWSGDWVVLTPAPRGEYTWRSVDPTYRWLLGLVVLTFICGSLGTVFGEIVHRIRRRNG